MAVIKDLFLNPAFAAMILVATGLEQGAYMFGAAVKSRFPSLRSAAVGTIAAAVLYGLAGALITGRLGEGMAAAIILGAARWFTGKIKRGLPPSLFTGVAAITVPYLAVAVWWMLALPETVVWFWEGLRLVSERVSGEASLLTGPTAASVLLKASAYIFIGGGGTVVTRAALGLPDAFDYEGASLAPGGDHRGAASPGTRLGDASSEVAAALSPEDEELYRWGRMIGNLERFLILTLALYGQYASIGLVLAAKSVARFDMARHRAEYFLVGTLTSLTLALTVGLVISSLTSG